MGYLAAYSLPVDVGVTLEPLLSPFISYRFSHVLGSCAQGQGRVEQCARDARELLSPARSSWCSSSSSCARSPLRTRPSWGACTRPRDAQSGGSGRVVMTSPRPRPRRLLRSAHRPWRGEGHHNRDAARPPHREYVTPHTTQPDVRGGRACLLGACCALR